MFNIGLLLGNGATWGSSYYGTLILSCMFSYVSYTMTFVILEDHSAPRNLNVSQYVSESIATLEKHRIANE